MKVNESDMSGVFEGLASHLLINDVCNMQKNELLVFQERLGMGGEWGTWEIPASAMPDGQLQLPSRRILQMKNILRSNLTSDNDVERAWTEIVRYGVVRSLVAGIRKLAKPSTVSAELTILIMFARKILSKQISATGFWSFLLESEAAQINAHGLSVARTMKSYYLRGLIPDAPREDIQVKGNNSERDRQGELDSPQSSEDGREWKPFPDIFTSECGWRSLKIIRELGPTLLDALERAFNLPVASRSDGKPLHPRRQQVSDAKLRDKVIKDWDWATPGGVPLHNLGFELDVKQTASRPFEKEGKLPLLEWPPKTFSDAWGLLSLIQGAHLFVVCLASGPRASEVAALDTGCLRDVTEGSGRILGKTFKFADEYGGRVRDVPAPEVVIEAVLQQIRLSELVKKRGGIAGDHLWVHLRDFGRSYTGHKHVTLTKFLDDFSKKLKLKELLGPEYPNVHLHRFRKTLARIVALSLVNSPIILMDCFGHEDPGMTIRSYILSDKKIARDVLVVQRELVVLMAVDIINSADELGGVAGEQLRERKRHFLKLLGKSEFEPQDAYEFARRETFDGRSWVMVAPGVYCTLPTGEGGPCSKAQVGTNPAYCKTGCPFQLLTNYNRIVVEDAVVEILKNLQKAVDEDEPMLIAQWGGQLNNWLYRWRDIAEKWVQHPLVKMYGIQSEINI